MRKFFPVEELARDSRFTQINMRQSQADPRTALIGPNAAKRLQNNRLTPSRPDASEAARNLMHGIFVGEIQALEGAGRLQPPHIQARESGETVARGHDNRHTPRHRIDG